jgi:hypothetical protein
MTEDELQELADVMVWGVAEAFTVDGKTYEAFEPLPVWHAAAFMGIRRKRAKVALTDPKFRKAYGANLDGMRNGERARNLATAIKIRDDSGEGLAADRTVQLKAIATIEGRDGAGGVTVNLNQTNNTLNVTPGYVIRLRPTDAPPALAAPSAPPMIDVTPTSQPDKVTQ